MRRRPVIGVTGPDRGGAAAWFFTRLAVRRAGGRPRRITPAEPLPAEDLDGLIIGGGADVDPRLYGQERQEIFPPLREVPQGGWSRLKGLLTLPLVMLARRLFSSAAEVSGDEGRDRLEKRLLAQAIDGGLPVLGICRGAQLLNVFFGGTLHQDLADFYVETPQIRTTWPRKAVRIEPGSCLARLLGSETALVNALHRQAVDRLGEELTAVARESNGVIQAIEHPGRPFLLGVQWHPEYLPQEKSQQRLFRALVREAAKRGGHRAGERGTGEGR